ncbi:MAG: hypothetical protein WD805_02015 [Gaiellaceae bacterium]
MTRRRGAALFCLGLVLGTLSVSPAGAHVGGSVAHLWKHLRPLASKVFYTKAQSNARYYPKADADARFAARGDVDGRFYTKAESDGRYYSRNDSDGRYYTKPDADLRFELKGQGGQTFQSYCTRAAANPRSYPQEPCTAGLAVTLDAAGVVGEFTSVAIGADGMPILSYRDVTNNDLKIVHCGNAACTGGNLVAPLDTGGTVGADTSLAIGTDGLPVVSYRDASNDSLKMLHCGDVTCSAGNVATTVDNGFVGSDTSIAIGADGFPVVSYFDGSNSDLKVLHCGNASCTSGNQATTADPGIAVVGYDTSIAIGSDGLPVVSYYDQTNSDLKVLHCGNASCTSGNAVTAVDSLQAVGESTSLAIGTDGLPVVSYRDASNGDLKVLHCGNAACTAGNQATGVDSVAPFLGYDTSIAIGTDGFPLVSYYDAGSENLKFLSCGNAACTSGNEAITVDSAGLVGRFTSLAVGMDGLPVVTYFDETNGDLKLARPPVS